MLFISIIAVAGILFSFLATKHNRKYRIPLIVVIIAAWVGSLIIYNNVLNFNSMQSIIITIVLFIVELIVLYIFVMLLLKYLSEKKSFVKRKRPTVRKEVVSERPTSAKKAIKPKERKERILSSRVLDKISNKAAQETPKLKTVGEMEKELKAEAVYDENNNVVFQKQQFEEINYRRPINIESEGGSFSEALKQAEASPINDDYEYQPDISKFNVPEHFEEVDEREVGADYAQTEYAHYDVHTDDELVYAETTPAFDYGDGDVDGTEVAEAGYAEELPYVAEVADAQAEEYETDEQPVFAQEDEYEQPVYEQEDEYEQAPIYDYEPSVTEVAYEDYEEELPYVAEVADEQGAEYETDDPPVFAQEEESEPAPVNDYKPSATEVAGEDYEEELPYVSEVAEEQGAEYPEYERDEQPILEQFDEQFINIEKPQQDEMQTVLPHHSTEEEKEITQYVSLSKYDKMLIKADEAKKNKNYLVAMQLYEGSKAFAPSTNSKKDIENKILDCLIHSGKLTLAKEKIFALLKSDYVFTFDEKERIRVLLSIIKKMEKQ